MNKIIWFLKKEIEEWCEENNKIYCVWSAIEYLIEHDYIDKTKAAQLHMHGDSACAGCGAELMVNGLHNLYCPKGCPAPSA